MKKSFTIYSVCWAILLAIFLVICFVTPDETVTGTKFNGVFWTSFAFVLASFLIQIIGAFKVFKQDTLKKLFYNIPLLKICYTSLIVLVIVSSVCFAIPVVPTWASIIVNVIITGITLISIFSATGAAEVVTEIDEKIKEKTFFIKSMTVEAQSILNRAPTEEAKAECKNVYEAFRYSDPMSDERLLMIENDIAAMVQELAKCDFSDIEKVKNLCADITNALKDRNARCKLYK